jgi:hypothetical protein
MIEREHVIAPPSMGGVGEGDGQVAEYPHLRRRAAR